MLVIWILFLSTLLQVIAAFLAFRLISATGRRTAWTLIATAISLMAVRRGVTLVEWLAGNLSQPPPLPAELVALAISVLMVVGIAAVAPLVAAGRRSQEESREREQRYRALFEQSRDAIYITTVDGRFLDFNQAALDLFGYDRHEFIGQDVSKLYVNPADRERFQQEIERHGSLTDYEVRLRRKDGTEIDCLLSSSIRRDARGTILGYQGIIRDITERKKAEEARMRAEQRYRQLFEEAPVMYVITREQGGVPIITDCNKLFLDTLGYTRAEVLERPLADFYTPESRDKLLHGGYDQALKGKFIAQERGLVTKEGHVVDTLLRATPEFDADGRVFGTRAMYVDITERKRAEKALRESEERFRTVTEGALAGVYIIQDGKFRYVNPALAEIFGYTPAEIIDKLGPAELTHPEDRSMVSEYVRRRLEGKVTAMHYGFRGLRKDGTMIHCEVLGSRAEYMGRPAIIGTLLDITARKQAEEALRRSEEQLRQAQKMEAIGRLAGGVAHDFNNLLTAVMGYSEFLLNEFPWDDQRRRYLQEIYNTAERAASLTRQLLAFSRKQVLQPRVVNMNAILASVEKMLRRLIGEDIDLVTVQEPQLGAVKVDPSQIEQVILNLAINARDAMPHGGKLTLETSNVHLDEDYARRHAGVRPGRYVMLAVSDTGSGMDAETRSRIFEPFFTTKRHGKGTGLGLATVYGIVKQSGGHIWVYSEPGRGTTFKIYFPRVEEKAESVDAGAGVAQTLQGTETILLVEDEEVVRDVASRILDHYGYTVLEARSGAQALRICEEHKGPIHLLVTDVVMPQMSGRQLAEQLAELRPQIKVLYVSGYTDNAIVHHGVLEEGTAFLGKPFTPEALARKVREVLDAEKMA